MFPTPEDLVQCYDEAVKLSEEINGDLKMLRNPGMTKYEASSGAALKTHEKQTLDEDEIAQILDDDEVDEDAEYAAKPKSKE